MDYRKQFNNFKAFDSNNKEVPISTGAWIVVQIIRIYTLIYHYTTWPFYYLFRKEKPTTNEYGRKLAEPTIAEDPSSPWRAVEALSEDKLISSIYPDVTTLPQMFQRSVKLWPNKNAYGTRELLKVEQELQPNGRSFVKMIQGDYYWLTYKQADRRVQLLSRALRVKAQMRPRIDNAVIFAETRVEWLLSAFACFNKAIPVVTLYSTLGEEAIVHGMNESEASLLFTSAELMPKMLKLMKRINTVVRIVYFERERDLEHFKLTDCDNVVNGSNAPVVIESWMKFMNGHSRRGMVEGAGDGEVEVYPDGTGELEEVETVEAKPQDLALIMYTSGSTGLPKGVEITHSNLLASMGGLAARLPDLDIHSDIFVAYLPVAHVLELCCELVCTAVGLPLGYGSPLTLTDQSSKVKAGTKGDVSVLRPTMMACVPTILDRLSKTVWEKVNSKGPFAREVFVWALQYKMRRMIRGLHSILLRKIVFRSIRKILGGKVRYILSGGAPLSEDHQLFVNACFGRIVSGYGLTETCGAGTLSLGGNLRGAHAGAPLRSLEIQLKGWEEGGYDPSDKPRPRGEVLIGGDVVTRGYYKQPEKTAMEYFVDKSGKRWFKTGDIGAFNADGTLSIIDRKKDLVKLQHGEYISLGKVELALSVSSIVESICIYGDSFKTAIVALVVPKKKAMLDLAAEVLNVPTEQVIAEAGSYDNLLKMDKIRKAALKQLADVGRRNGLERVEIPVAVNLDAAMWTPERGLVTDALKLKRNELKKHYNKEIEVMYKSVNM